ncbi:TetR/AcrR family transcriptional regulator [Crocinitomix catalasitica]|uniref:TetR/AcrR family transcriptional regulator n=1 Tax=Crocinitomix catalasitica TaxID=184607 RepID=UPI000482545F|nr:TetR/AcrR family transcriptional regulator [Crocinitomix catalasitica]
MKGKAALTTDFIVETVAPIFNKNGYYGTSLSHLTKATGLTKGAIYGNFKNKEDIAFAAFEFNVDVVVEKIKADLADITDGVGQLYALFNFYRKYRMHTIAIGGCPIINIGVDANHQNDNLLHKVQEVIERLQYYIQKMIVLGQDQGTIKSDINAVTYAKRIFASIEGAMFMTATMNDESYINDMMDHIDNLVKTELEINSH